MTSTRPFHIHAVVSVATEIMVCDSFGDIHELLDFMLDKKHFTHELPTAFRLAHPSLLEQHPWLAELTPPEGDAEAVKTWRAQVAEEHGELVDVAPAPNAEWAASDPLENLDKIAPNKPVIVVTAPGARREDH